MVTTSKTWTSTLNFALNTTNQSTQYKEFMLELSDQLIAAGWTVVRSCDSLTTSGTNLWTSTTAIVYGVTASSQARSWNIFRAPATWGSPTGGGYFYYVLDCQHTNASSNPQSYFAYFSTALPTEAVSNPTTTALTFNTSQTHAFTSSSEIFSWTAAVASYASFWRTSSGDVLWFTKRGTDGSYTRCGGVIDPTNARGNWRGTAFISGTLSPSITIPWSTSARWVGLETDGTNVSTNAGLTVTASSPAHTASSWNGGTIAGADSAGDVMYSQMIGLVNSLTDFSRRYYGVIPDIWVTQSSSFSFDDTSDTDPTILRGFNGIALPVPSGTGALL
jgi:hypothetical protein